MSKKREEKVEKWLPHDKQAKRSKKD